MRSKRFMKIAAGMFLTLIVVFFGLTIPSEAVPVSASIFVHNDTTPPAYFSSPSGEALRKPEYYVNSVRSQIAYCIAPGQDSPYFDYVANSNQMSTLSPTLQNGLTAIFSKGYPFNDISSASGLSASQQRYATAAAVAFLSGTNDYYPKTGFDLRGIPEANINSAKTSGIIYTSTGSQLVRANSGQVGVMRYALDLYQIGRDRAASINNGSHIGVNGGTFKRSGDSFTTKGTLRLNATAATTLDNYGLSFRTGGVSAIRGGSGKNGTAIELSMDPSIVAQTGSLTFDIRPIDKMFDRDSFFVTPRPAGKPGTQPVITLFGETPVEAYGPGKPITYNLPPDLKVESVTTNGTTFEPGEEIRVTVNVKNISRSSVSSSSYSLRLEDTSGNLVTRSKTMSGLGSLRTDSHVFVYTAPTKSAKFNPNLVATIDPGGNVYEATKSNNRGSRQITVNAGLPDLVPKIEIGKSAYEAGETVKIDFYVKNSGLSTASAFSSRATVEILNDSAADIGDPDPLPKLPIKNRALDRITSLAADSKYVHLGEITFIAPERLSAKTIRATLTVDSGGEVAESNESNNTISADTTLRALRPDLYIVSDNLQAYYEDKEVIVTVGIGNLTHQPVKEADIRLTMNGVSVTEKIAVVGKNSSPDKVEGIAVFRIKTPTLPEDIDEQNFMARIEIDPAGKLNEISVANNKLTKSVPITKLFRNQIPDPDDSRMEEDHLARNKAIPEIPNTDSLTEHVWSEIRYENNRFVERTFFVELHTDFSITPDPRVAIKDKPKLMESGFGLRTEATTYMVTNYDRLDKLVGPQIFWTFHPETGYFDDPNWELYANALTTPSGYHPKYASVTWEINDEGYYQGAVASWQLPVNPYSVTESRLHYTPVWFPDDQYEVLGQSFYAWVPSIGQLYERTTDYVEIEGDMYDRYPVFNR